MGRGPLSWFLKDDWVFPGKRVREKSSQAKEVACTKVGCTKMKGEGEESMWRVMW